MRLQPRTRGIVLATNTRAEKNFTIILTDDQRAIAKLYESRPQEVIGVRISAGSLESIFQSAHVGLWIAKRTDRGYESAPVVTMRQEAEETAMTIDRMFNR